MTGRKLALLAQRVRGRVTVSVDSRLAELLLLNCSHRYRNEREARDAARCVATLSSVAQIDERVQACLGAWLHGHCDVDAWNGEIGGVR